MSDKHATPLRMIGDMQDAHPENGKVDAAANNLRDGYGRRFSYLRLSLTERCNFRCTYCLPNGFQKQRGLPPELSREEIRRVVAAFAKLGLWKVRLTGGEPTVRQELTEIVRDVAAVPGIRQLAMTSNGYRLKDKALEWRDAGIDALNISIDTLDADRFKRITGHDRLDAIISGIDAALAAQFSAVKINSVLMQDIAEDDWNAILEFVTHRPVSWRFIELMRTNDNAGFHARQASRSDVIRQRLEQSGWCPSRRTEGSGPAVVYSHSDYRGTIGLIAPYSPGFCDTCNRLRVSSRGKLHLCLFGTAWLDLRDLLQSDDQCDALIARIRAAMPGKTAGHRLHYGDSGATPHLASIGG